MADLAGVALLGARIAFAAVLLVLAVGNLRDRASMVAYAESKGAPLPAVTVPLASLALLAGSLSILVGAYPLIGALAVAGFLATVTPVMHDFWNLEGADRQNEWHHFTKNVGLFGAALAFAALAGSPWPSAVGLTV
jgi:uncharacterized membrane protein YphA (DoxX/SURF4 family)